MPQTEKPDDLQLVAIQSGFCVCMTIAFHDGNIPKESASFPWIKEPKRCALSVRAAFGNLTSVYGHIDENGRFVRNWPVRKMAITDKMVKNSRLSVKIQTFRTRFYGQMLRKAACVRKSSE